MTQEGKAILVKEVNLIESGGVTSYEIKAASIRRTKTLKRESEARLSILNKFQKLLIILLLPKGYPESVCPEYIRFQFWDTSQEACGYFRGILSNQSYLISLGVGNPARTVFSAIVMTMILDYVRMVSGLLAASSTQAIQKVAINQKFWTMFKEGLGLITCILTITSAYYHGNVIVILIIANVVSAWEGVIAGCCHATLVTHIARQNNFSDCNAKEGNQSRALKFIIIGLGYKFLILVHENGRASLLALFLLSILKLLCQYKAMKALKLRTLSPKRLELCVKAWRENRLHDMAIAAIASEETVLYPQYAKVNEIGGKIQDLNCRGAHLTRLMKIHHNVNHVVVASDNKLVYVLLKVGASNEDILKGYVHALSFSFLLDRIDTNNVEDVLTLKIKESLDRTTQDFPRFIQTLQRFEWDIENPTLLPSSSYRLQEF